MKIQGFNRCALSSCAAAAMLAACGGSQLQIGTPGAMPKNFTISAPAIPPRVHSSKYKVLFSFNDTDGKYPSQGLLDVDGALYGSTLEGGSSGIGIVFSMSLTGEEKVLYNFSGPDGAYPTGSLIDVKGKLYGATVNGGDYDEGVVFRLSKGGTEKVLYSFGGYSGDGWNPWSPVYVNGALYGTTSYGGNGGGTVFSMSLSGKEKVLHTFTTYPYDGSSPEAGLIYVKGLLYGTTAANGTIRYGTRDSNYGRIAAPAPEMRQGFHEDRRAPLCYEQCNPDTGTVFSISTTGTEKVLYSFDLYSDGASPEAALTFVRDKLYGTTNIGGAYGSNYGGTAFSIKMDGSDERVLHNFGHGSDGCCPITPLLYAGGKFYGTTLPGGAYGKGILFSMSLSGKEKVLHSFGYGSDGSEPDAGLIDVHGTLYGTTSAGGKYGYGTVFTLTP